MGNTESKRKIIEGRDAVKKLRELAEDAKTCMFTTALRDDFPQCDPMTLQGVDDNGNLWFISSSESDRNHNIQSESRVQLYFSNVKSFKYLYILGNAEIVDDRKKIDEYWNAFSNAWFDGKDDPRVSLIKVSPVDTKFWETEDSNLMTFLKISISAITGKIGNDGGVIGKLEV